MTATSEQLTAQPDIAFRLRRATEGAAQPRPANLPDRFDGAGTRRRLYEAALRLFGERGYHAVSVRDLAKELDVQASSFYAHVPSKQQLLADLIRMGHEEHRDAVRSARLAARPDPAEQLASVVRAHVLFHCRHPLLARVCNRELRSLDEARRSEVVTVRVETEQVFYEVIERGQKLGVFSPDDPLLAVAAIASMGMRVAEWWYPALDVGAEEVADTYAVFAVRLLTGAG